MPYDPPGEIPPAPDTLQQLWRDIVKANIKAGKATDYGLPDADWCAARDMLKTWNSGLYATNADRDYPNFVWAGVSVYPTH